MAAAAREYFGPLAGLLSAGRKAWVHSRCCRDRAKGRDGCKLPRRSLQSDCRTFWRTPERAPSRPLPGSQEEEESPRLAVDRPRIPLGSARAAIQCLQSRLITKRVK